MQWKALGALAAMAAAVDLGCGNDDDNGGARCDWGREGCPCTGNASCNAPLECRFWICVRPDGGTEAGARADAPDGAETGADATDAAADVSNDGTVDSSGSDHVAGDDAAAFDGVLTHRAGVGPIETQFRGS